MNINTFLEEKISKAMVAAGAPVGCKAQVRQSTNTHFGDYQANGVMAIAKLLGVPSRQLAENVVSMLDLAGIVRKVDIAGPGFINIFLDKKWVATKISELLASPRLGISLGPPQTIVVDYSAPNVAKDMHVGHVRSTIIGDASVRTLEFLGHHVIRANHVGDWGTQFGMLIAYIEKVQSGCEVDMQLYNLESFYRQANKYYNENPAFAERARSYVVKLQSGDAYCCKMWRKLLDVTISHNQNIYERLNVTLSHKDVMGESLYNDMLSGIVADLKEKGLAVENEGAIVVFIDEFNNKKGSPMGVIIQKNDGAYLYITTEIACAKYRYEILKADRVIYYVDSRQHQHLLQARTIVRKAGYVPESVTLEHNMFGMMLGKDGKPFKTRAGFTVKLTDLLDEALERAHSLIASKNPDIDAAELERLVQVVGIGAVKYADLSKNRTTDYVFDLDNMLSLEGNTAPYMQYAYTRILSILKHSGLDEQQFTGRLQLEAEQDNLLAVRLLQYEEAVTIVARDGTPHVLCTYLYDIAVLLSAFYEHCPIINASSESLRNSRIQLALLTSRTLKQGLNLLGIDTVERM